MTRGSRWPAFWLGAVLAVLFVAPLHAQTLGTIMGSVTDGRTGEPIPGAEVYISERLGTVADREGKYRLVNVPVGTRTLNVRMIGYGSNTAPVTVIAGQ